MVYHHVPRAVSRAFAAAAARDQHLVWQRQHRRAADQQPDHGGRRPRRRETGLRRLTLWCLAITATLGLAFLVVKGFEYHEDISKHLIPGRALPPA